MSTVALERQPGGAMQAFGTVAHRVVVDGRWVGWVGDARELTASGRLGGRRWWACWRQDGDTAARWDSGSVLPTRRAAVDALLARIGTQP